MGKRDRAECEKEKERRGREGEQKEKNLTAFCAVQFHPKQTNKLKIYSQNFHTTNQYSPRKWQYMVDQQL
jgi:hypothetical protein